MSAKKPFIFLCRNREPQCTCSHPEPLAATGAGGKQRPGAGGAVAGEPHRHRGQSVIVSGGAEINISFQGVAVKKQQSFESYLDSEGNKKQSDVDFSDSYPGWK